MKQNKKIKIVLLICLVLLVIILGLLFWLYSGKITSTKKTIYGATHLPAAFVNLQPVSLSALSQRYDLLKVIQNNKVNLNDPNIKSFVLEKLIADKELQILAQAKKIKVSKEQIDDLYSQMASDLTAGDPLELEKAINSYAGLNKKDFQNQVLESFLLERGLKTWYYSQKELNPSLYSAAQNILSSAKNGEEFGGLAQKYSQDGATAVFDGDSGFVETTQLTPEIAQALGDAKTDEVRQVAGFDGLHIIKILGKDNNGTNGNERVRLQHIFLEGKGYETWRSQALKEFKVIKLTNKLSF